MQGWLQIWNIETGVARPAAPTAAAYIRCILFELLFEEILHHVIQVAPGIARDAMDFPGI